MDAKPQITGVAEIVLSVADLPAMRDFYSTVLGFAVHSEASFESDTPNPDGRRTDNHFLGNQRYGYTARTRWSSTNASSC